MSFRELRNFKEIMATLGYPRLISIENFKVPHFELVADVLVWLCHRYDKNMEILSDIRTEQDRVAFLKSVAEQLLVKARVKLNLKNLYASNGFAVRRRPTGALPPPRLLGPAACKVAVCASSGRAGARASQGGDAAARRAQERQPRRGGGRGGHDGRHWSRA